MFLWKKNRDFDKEMIKGEKKILFDEKSVIKVKVDNREQIFSKFNYESSDKLNPEFGEFLAEKIKEAPVKNDIEIELYTKEDMNIQEVESTLKNHFKNEYLDARVDKKKNLIFSLSMLLLGIAALAIYFLVEYLSSHYFKKVIEIASWVFMWEAVNSFFLQGPMYSSRCLKIQHAYKAKINIIKQK